MHKNLLNKIGISQIDISKKLFILIFKYKNDF